METPTLRNPKIFDVAPIHIAYRDKIPTEMELIEALNIFTIEEATPTKRLVDNLLKIVQNGSYMKAPRNIRSLVESYLDESFGQDYFYIDSQEGVIRPWDLPALTPYNYGEKRFHFFVEALNHAFEPLEKAYVDGVYRVKIPDIYFDHYAHFVNNKNYYQSLEEDKDLFDLINFYFRGQLLYKWSNFSPWSIFESKKYKDLYRLDEQGVLHVQVDPLAPLIGTGGQIIKSRGFSISHVRHDELYYTEFQRFLVKAVDFLMVCELIELYRERHELPSVTAEKERFIQSLEGQRVPVEAISHKGARTEAEELGLTHFFLPFNEEDIPAGTPFSTKTKLDYHKRKTNVWQLLPPTEGYVVIRDYFGHNKDYPNLTTKAEPHLVGEECLRAEFAPSFYDVLVEEYDWPYREEAVQTLSLAEKYPRLWSDLVRVGKETTDD